MTDRLLESYDLHPLTAPSILTRAGRLKSPARIAELQLAIDRAAEFTDQNHVGGLEQTIDLGLALGLSAKDRVLDLGCGLGGSARALATIFGCAVVGIDRHKKRIQDARHLSKLAGVASKNVRFVCADVLRPRAVPGRFTAVICQAAMAHFLWDSGSLLCLRPFVIDGARLGIEDCCTIADGRGSRSILPALKRLGKIWNVRFAAAGDWRERIGALCVRDVVETDFSEEFVAYYLKRSLLVARARIKIDAREAEGYGLAFKLGGAGILGYRRWTGRFEWPD